MRFHNWGERSSATIPLHSGLMRAKMRLDRGAPHESSRTPGNWARKLVFVRMDTLVFSVVTDASELLATDWAAQISRSSLCTSSRHSQLQRGRSNHCCRFNIAFMHQCSKPCGFCAHHIELDRRANFGWSMYGCGYNRFWEGIDMRMVSILRSQGPCGAQGFTLTEYTALSSHFRTRHTHASERVADPCIRQRKLLIRLPSTAQMLIEPQAPSYGWGYLKLWVLFIDCALVS